MDYSIPMNETKLKNGFYVLLGPGINITYTQADQVNGSQSFVKNSKVVTGGGLTDVMSDGDADNLRQTGSNAMASGNVNKFYDVGFEHNKKNLIQLEKQYLQVELAGCNLGILRGEKIPVLLLDNDILMQKSTYNDPKENENSVHLVQRALYQTASGWYIIGGIMWEWKRSRPEDGVTGSTLWRTHCKLKRREWPIVGYGMADAGQDIVLNQVIESSIPKTKTLADEQSRETPAEEPVEVPEDEQTDGEVPLTGLKPQLIEVYKVLKEKCPGIKLVSARRWAVDANGNRTEGNAFLMKNGLYKCVNANGKAMYFKSNNSKHLYGEAFDIINGPGQSFQGIMNDYVLKDPDILKTMLDNGVSACVETTQDDAGVQTKHYHFGTEDYLVDQFWNTVPLNIAAQIFASASAVRTNQIYVSSEINNATVEEA